MSKRRKKISNIKALQYGGLAALALATVGVGWYALQPPQQAPVPAAVATFQPAEAKLTPPPTLPAVAFIGDSFVAGSSQDKGRQFPDMLASKNGYMQIMMGEGGSGYVTPGNLGTTFGQRVQAAIDAKPAMVVVSGGFNDKDVAALPAAVRDTLTRLRDGLPGVPIVALSNFVPTGEPTAVQQQKHDIIQAAADEVGVTFIDVIDIFDGTTGTVGTDKTHPTAEGHQHIADVLAPQLPAPKV